MSAEMMQPQQEIKPAALQAACLAVVRVCERKGEPVPDDATVTYLARQSIIDPRSRTWMLT